MAQSSGEYGVLSIQDLPDPTWQEQWDGIVVAEGIKDRLLNFGLFVLGHREHLSQVGLPVHGIVLLEGPPGTGKTTLARGLAHMVAETFHEEQGTDTKTVYCEIDAYRLASGLLGESQKHVERLFFRSIPNLATDYDRLIVLIDEVENIAVSRIQASLDANPVDVHRATNALLTGLDHVSQNCRNVLLVGTSNFKQSLDPAFLSRVDIVQEMGLPDPDILLEIVLATLRELEIDTAAFVQSGEASQLAKALSGMDGRQARKQILEALISKRRLALHPSELTAEDVVETLRR